MSGAEVKLGSPTVITTRAGRVSGLEEYHENGKHIGWVDPETGEIRLTDAEAARLLREGLYVPLRDACNWAKISYNSFMIRLKAELDPETSTGLHLDWYRVRGVRMQIVKACGSRSFEEFIKEWPGGDTAEKFLANFTKWLEESKAERPDVDDMVMVDLGFVTQSRATTEYDISPMSLRNHINQERLPVLYLSTTRSYVSRDHLRALLALYSLRQDFASWAKRLSSRLDDLYADVFDYASGEAGIKLKMSQPAAKIKLQQGIVLLLEEILEEMKTELMKLVEVEDDGTGSENNTEESPSGK